MTNFVIADPGLTSVLGHHFQVSLAYSNAAAAKGMGGAVLGNRALDPFSATAHGGKSIVPFFCYNPYDPPRWLRANQPRPTIGPTISRLAKDLLTATPRFDLNAESVVYFHSCSFSLINDLFDYFLLRPASQCPVFMLRLIYEHDPSGLTYPAWYLTQLRKKLVHSGLVGRNVFLFAETQVLADQAASTLDSEVQRIHHIKTTNQPSKLPGLADPELLTFAFLGDARKEKGFHLLPDVVAALGKIPSAHKSELLIQATSSGIDPENRRTVERTLAEVEAGKRDLKTTVLGEHLDNDTYAGLIEEVDVPLLLHDPTSYRTRGSAIFYDTILSGKPFMVRAGSSMAAERNLKSCIVWDPRDRLEDILENLVRSIDEYRAAAGAVAAQFRTATNPATIIDGLIEQAKGRDTRNLPSCVLHVFPMWFGQGSSHVFQCHSDYLHARNFRSVNAVVVTWDSSGESEPEFYRHLFEGTADDASFYTFHLQRSGDLSISEKASLTARNFEHLSYVKERGWLFDAEVPAGLNSLLHSDHIAFLWINYSHYMIAKQIFGPSHKILLETHDFRSHQYAIESNNPANEQLDGPTELAWMKEATGTIFISQKERELFLSAGGSEESSIVAFPVSSQQEIHVPSMQNKLCGRDLLADVFHGDREQRSLLQRYRQSTLTPRVIFVGSGHPSNTVSFDWFLRDIYYPHLAGRLDKVFAVGTIADRYPPNLPGVEFLGRVKYLGPIYDAADLVLLPIIEGTGLPIKSIDAIVAGRPLVATSGAIKGIVGAEEYITAYDTPESFAQEITRLLTDDAYRNKLLARLKAFRKQLFNTDSYYAALDKLLMSSNIPIFSGGMQEAKKTPRKRAAQPPSNRRPLSKGNIDRLLEDSNRDAGLVGDYLIDRNYLWLQVNGTSGGGRLARVKINSLIPLNFAASINGSTPKVIQSDETVATVLFQLGSDGKANVELYVADSLDFTTRSAITLTVEQVG